MGDPDRKVLPGDQVEFPAAWFNLTIDANKAFRRRQFDRTVPQRRFDRPTGRALVRNTTSDPLPQFSVLGVHSPIFDPSASASAESGFRQRPLLDCVEPSIPDHLGRWCILAEPLVRNAIGWAWLDGVCLGRVKLRDENHTHAEIVDGESGFLETRPAGSARILWLEDVELDEVGWAVLLLGQSGPDWAYATLIGDLASGGTASAYIAYEQANGTVGAAQYVAEVSCPLLPPVSYLPSGTVAAVMVDRVTGRWNVIAPNACAIPGTPPE